MRRMMSRRSSSSSTTRTVGLSATGASDMAILLAAGVAFTLSVGRGSRTALGRARLSGSAARRFPTAFTVLAGVLLAVWLLSFVIPSGAYDVDAKTGGPVPGTYHRIDTDKSVVHQFSKLWAAPTDGLYGIENDRGGVSVDNTGTLYGSAQIFLFVLAIGAFITVTMKTGAIQTGIGRLALRFRHSPAVLIVVLMGVFALGGTTEGMWEETLGFFVLLVPLTLALGFDRMTGAGIIFLGCGSGVLASTVNPFATGVASDAAGVGVGDGIALRLLMWVVIVGLAIAYVLRYAFRVRRDASHSVLGPEGLTSAGLPMADDAAGDVAPLTRRQGFVLVLFFSAFALMIYGFIPWKDIWQTIFSASFPLPTFQSFYFAQASVLFIVMAVVIGLVAKLGEEGTVTTIVSGASDFLGPALIIVLARAVTVVMKNSEVTDTLLHWMESGVSGTSSGVFGGVAVLVNLPIAFLVPSSSGHAALVMPILGPLADFADVPRSIAVTAFQSASGLVNLITPTSAVIMGGLALSKIGYDRYLRFVLPFFGIALVLCLAFVGVGAAVS
ncbi:YfcC family protein [Patulibacter sp. NPDC049589]|uniref:YfcC family protein n=1 Tax=Patulibacter sp. NPDC049589 TaxID=3154731 RepID=UPI003413C82D